jgi:hypothetical protein
MQGMAVDTTTATAPQAQHTPGTWRAEQFSEPGWRSYVVIYEKNRIIAELLMSDNQADEEGLSHDDAHALLCRRAALASAAPDLLAALKDIGEQGLNTVTWDAACAAIAMAEGRS